MSVGNIGYSEGFASPASVKAEVGHTYKWLKNGLTYSQVGPGISNAWVEVGAVDPPDGNGIYGGTGIVPTNTVATVTDTFTLDGGLVEVTGDLETRDLTITDNNTLNLQTTDSVGYPTINNTFVPVGIPPYTVPDAGPAIKVGNKIFYSDYWYNVLVYDADTNTQLGVSATITDGSYNLAYNPTLDRVYVGNWEMGTHVAYMDATTFATTNIPITGPSPYIGKLLFDDINQVLYSRNSSLDIVQYDADFVYTGVTITPALGIDDVGIVDIGLDTTGNLIITSFDSIWFYDNTGTLLNTLSGYRNNSDYAQATDNLGIAVSGAGQFTVFVANKFAFFNNGNTNPFASGVNTIGGETYTTLVITEYSVFGGIRTAAFVSATYPLGYGYSQLGNFVPLFGGFIYPALTFTKTNGNLFVYFSGTNIFYEIEQLFLTNLTVSIDTETLTENRTQLLRDADGTIALLSDIPAPTPSTSLGNSVFVSAEGKTVANGAVRESLTDHFSNINEAVTAALSGDTIYVYGGTHTVTATLTKAGVNWHFLGKPTIFNNSSQSLFTDLYGVTTINVKGNAIFQSGSSVSAVKISNANTIYNIECDTITGNASRSVEIYGGTAESILKVDTKITNTGVNWAVRLGEYAFGQGTIICPNITSNATIGALRQTILMNSGNYTIIGNVKNESGISDGTIATFGGTLNIIGNVTANPAADANGEWQLATIRIYSPTTLTMTGNIIGNLKRALWIGGGATGSLITINGNMESLGSRTTVLIEAGSFITLDGKITGNASTNVIEANSLSSGYLKLNGSIINQHVPGAATNGVNVFGSTGEIIFNNVIIRVDDSTTPAAIIASGAKNVMIYGYVTANVDKDATITDIIGAGRFNFNSSVI